ncbi:PTS sugar transporter subunit IIB [Anaerococcus sp. AGMB00486]|uniref:PTS sugar transporter subunit IIB n=2 Tax=Anaerococcus TaxID=165779 RepID=A0ABX2NBZ5_9FIRM|nr:MULTISPECIES: PTS sugar transporter subunit IIB [Anaerococcus]MDY3005824.1 PTS sugar transporter subunit IIB [Anaerococcus porci]MSS78679.1 PTS sugar transporter subunit IIB [Anaerococcus porci]NVF12180.1 PTS sugar transporter subunit IIB [Anaerococcus faecalis]
MKRIIVACGSGVATSQTVASKLERELEKKGIRVKVDAVDMKSLDYHIKNADAYVSIVKPEKDYGIPVFNGIAFLTGIGMEQELEKIIDYINK